MYTVYLCMTVPLLSIAIGDNEGELDEGFCDELGDEGFAHLLIPDDPSDSSMIPTATLLEDFDLGVDMFDSTEQTTIPTSEPLKSPAFGQLSPAGPGSPYQLVATSSPIPISPHNVHSQNNYNEYLNHSGSNSSGSPAYSQHSGCMPPTTTAEDELAMLLCEDLTGGDLNAITSTPLSLPMSTCGQHTSAYSTMPMDFTSQPVSYASSTFGSQVDPSFATPTLTSIHMGQPSLMDLAEASQLAGLTSDAGLMSMTTGQLDTTPMISSSSADINFSSSMNSCLPLSGVSSSVAAGAQVCSRSSQTQQNNNRLTRSLSPAPSHAHSPASSYHRQSHSPSPSPRTSHYSTSSIGSSSSGACYYAPSPGGCNSPSSTKSPGKVGVSTDRLVDMPFYQFKKILDDPSVDPTEKEEVKTIRKRGKNKVAAKNCRQKKIEVVMGLQQEVERMKEEKKRLDSKCQGLEREINSLKQRCSSFRSLAYSS